MVERSTGAVASQGLTPRGRQARDQILAAAAQVLAEAGELEVAQVAVRAGVSDGLPYRYFGNRSGLIAAVVEDFHLRLSEAVVYADFEGETWQDREHQRVAAWVRFLYQEPLSPVMLSGLGGDATVAASWQRRLALAVEVGSRNIARGQRAGDLPKGNDPTLLAAAVLGGVQSAVATALASDPRPPEAEVTDALWTFVRGAAEAVPSRRRREAPVSRRRGGAVRSGGGSEAPASGQSGGAVRSGGGGDPAPARGRGEAAPTHRRGSIR